MGNSEALQISPFDRLSNQELEETSMAIKIPD